MSAPPAFDGFVGWLRTLQQRIVDAVEALEEAGGAWGPEDDGDVPVQPAPARFRLDSWRRDGASGTLAGQGASMVLEEGRVFERAAVNLSDVRGARLPPTASERHPEAAGRPFRAAGVSLVFHPRNPFVPTVHMNVRVMGVEDGALDAPWWFGGGWDLTPCAPCEEDALHWHAVARAACVPFGPRVHAALAEAADRYFWLPHRQEPRGIGGLFGEDLDARAFGELGPDQPPLGDSARAEALVRAIGESFLPAYLPVVLRHRSTPWTAEDRTFQLVRRGRYAEFNLAFDRGTHFGLQSGGRAESILVSMPPRARWRYDWHPPREQQLVEWVRAHRGGTG